MVGTRREKGAPLASVYLRSARLLIELFDQQEDGSVALIELTQHTTGRVVAINTSFIAAISSAPEDTTGSYVYLAIHARSDQHSPLYHVVEDLEEIRTRERVAIQRDLDLKLRQLNELLGSFR